MSIFRPEPRQRLNRPRPTRQYDHAGHRLHEFRPGLLAGLRAPQIDIFEPTKPLEVRQAGAVDRGVDETQRLKIREFPEVAEPGVSDRILGDVQDLKPVEGREVGQAGIGNPRVCQPQDAEPFEL